MGRLTMNLSADLTRRETQIAELLAWGAAKKEVADLLSISPRTVENTARNIYQKIGIQKATELCVYWFCAKCGVSPSLDPLKRAFIALDLLLVFIPYDYAAATTGDRTAVIRPARTVRAASRANRGRRAEDLTLTPIYF